MEDILVKDLFPGFIIVHKLHQIAKKRCRLKLIEKLNGHTFKFPVEHYTHYFINCNHKMKILIE